MLKQLNEFYRNKKAVTKNTFLTIFAAVIITICISAIFVGVKIDAMQDENNQLQQDIDNLQSSYAALNSAYTQKTYISQQSGTIYHGQLSIIHVEASSALGLARVWCQNSGGETEAIIAMLLEDTITNEIYDLTLTGNGVKKVYIEGDSGTYLVNAVTIDAEQTICNGTGNFLIDPNMLPTTCRIILITTKGVLLSPYFTVNI